MTHKPVDIIKAANTLGEGVLWDGQTQSLWWTDIQERRLYRCEWAGRTLRVFALPERLCSFGFIAGSKRLIAAFESGIALYDPFRDTTEWLTRPARGDGIRFNDGRVDRQGRFWTGTMAETDARAGQAQLFCIDAVGRAEPRESGITISNGICWSPDGAVFYFADSPRRTIWRYVFDVATGEISDRRVFAQTPDGAYPDGATVDEEGFVWSAQWGAGRVVRFAPDGRIDRLVEVPASQPSCVAFGGTGLCLLFVTSAREGLNKESLAAQPHAGDVFVYDLGIAGLPESRFKAGGEHGDE